MVSWVHGSRQSLIVARGVAVSSTLLAGSILSLPDVQGLSGIGGRYGPHDIPSFAADKRCNPCFFVIAKFAPPAN